MKFAGLVREQEAKDRSSFESQRMDFIPWEELEAVGPFLPMLARRPYDCRRMLVHCVQLFYNLSDPGTMLYEVGSVQAVVGPETVWAAGRDDDSEPATCWKSMSWARVCSRRSDRYLESKLRLQEGTSGRET